MLHCIKLLPYRMRINQAQRWSVDLGNVLVQNIPKDVRNEIKKIHESRNFAKLDKFLLLHSLLVPGAQAGLRALIDKAGSENVWIVSRASGMERKVNKRLLAVHRFWALTGLRSKHVHFVDHFAEKADICKQLRVDAHIDDRGEVHAGLQDIVPIKIWFAPSPNDIRRWSDVIWHDVFRAESWTQIIQSL